MKSNTENLTINDNDKITDDLFLNILVEKAKTYGWSGDYVEIVDFVNWGFDEQNKPHPDLTPYD